MGSKNVKEQGRILAVRSHQFWTQIVVAKNAFFFQTALLSAASSTLSHQVKEAKSVGLVTSKNIWFPLFCSWHLHSHSQVAHILSHFPCKMLVKNPSQMVEMSRNIFHRITRILISGLLWHGKWISLISAVIFIYSLLFLLNLGLICSSVWLCSRWKLRSLMWDTFLFLSFFKSKICFIIKFAVH